MGFGSSTHDTDYDRKYEPDCQEPEEIPNGSPSVRKETEIVDQSSYPHVRSLPRLSCLRTALARDSFLTLTNQSLDGLFGFLLFDHSIFPNIEMDYLECYVAGVTTTWVARFFVRL